jgi:hypothetical protein
MSIVNFVIMNKLFLGTSNIIYATLVIRPINVHPSMGYLDAMNVKGRCAIPLELTVR